MSALVSPAAPQQRRRIETAPLIVLIVLAGTVALLWWSGMAEDILAYSDDISYLTVQHLELVAWAGGLAILVAVPVASCFRGPPSASFRRR